MMQRDSDLDPIKRLKEWELKVCTIHPSPFLKKLYSRGFSFQQLVEITEVLDETCLHCFTGDKTCRCWDDS